MKTCLSKQSTHQSGNSKSECGGLGLWKRHYLSKWVGHIQELDYFLPDLKLPEEKTKHIGVWGQRHKRYLQEHKRATYTTLLTSGKLNGYLADIDKQAEEMFSRLVEQTAEREGVTERLKSDNQLEWGRRINNIRNRAIEIINNDLIYN